MKCSFFFSTFSAQPLRKWSSVRVRISFSFALNYLRFRENISKMLYFHIKNSQKSAFFRPIILYPPLKRDVSDVMGSIMRPIQHATRPLNILLILNWYEWSKLRKGIRLNVFRDRWSTATSNNVFTLDILV